MGLFILQLVCWVITTEDIIEARNPWKGLNETAEQRRKQRVLMKY